MNPKQILPIEWNYRLRHLHEWNRKDQPDFDVVSLEVNKRVFFLDAPAYGNIGDQAIAYAMESFISRILPDYKQIEITEDKLPSCLSWLKQNIRDNDLICLTGGGNMGVMYQRYESVRRLVLNTFPHNPIVIFPQTFDYGDNGYSNRELERAKRIYGNVLKLVLCARDEESYEKMKACFPKARVIFCPDIVLSLDYRDRFTRTGNVGICLRNDAESVIGVEDKQKIYFMYPGHTILSTVTKDDSMISYKNRREAVEGKLQEFGSKKIVITDRLHGTIFAFVTGTPVIALPNINGKVERVCKYLSPNGRVVFTRSIEEIPAFDVKSNSTVTDQFRELEHVIRNIAEE